jgi:cbb3-type cytochrome oxidase subunit 3
MTLLYNCVWWYAIRKKELMEENSDPGLINLLTKEYAIAPALHLAALIISFWNVFFSIIPIVLIYIYFALPRISEKKIRERSKAIKTS